MYTTSFLVTLAGLSHLAAAHTWAEAVNVINSEGTLVQPNGYSRNYVPRGIGNVDNNFQKVERNNVKLENARVCSDLQKGQQQSTGFPRVQASPGDMIAIRYAENGHTTRRAAGRAENSGNVYIYGTSEDADYALTSVMDTWTQDGNGDDGKGKLLAEQDFDDRHCWEAGEPSEEGSRRRAAYPITDAPAPDAQYSYTGLACQNDFRLPSDVPVGSPYSIYWVWNWSMIADPNAYEYYTFCLDVDVVAPKGGDEVFEYKEGQGNFFAAIPEYFRSLTARYN